MRTLYHRGSAREIPRFLETRNFHRRGNTTGTRVSTCTLVYGRMVNSMITPPPRESRAHVVAECYVTASSPTRSSTQSHLWPCVLYISSLLALPLGVSPVPHPARISLALSPLVPLCRTGVTCGADRRKGAWGGVGGDCQGGSEEDEGWFKRVNTSQLRSRRTLVGH